MQKKAPLLVTTPYTATHFLVGRTGTKVSGAKHRMRRGRARRRRSATQATGPHAASGEAQHESVTATRILLLVVSA